MGCNPGLLSGRHKRLSAVDPFRTLVVTRTASGGAHRVTNAFRLLIRLGHLVAPSGQLLGALEVTNAFRLLIRLGRPIMEWAERQDDAASQTPFGC